MKKEMLAPRPLAIDPLSLRPADAAKALGISERLLWRWTREQLVPHVRIGNVVLYPVDELQRWLNERTTRIAGGEIQAEEAVSTAAATSD
jgi:excisionase family DNA binding protein